ncbi:hypothetical protein DAPPUDRAFT_238587 [Daphnia pulex]|uniref:Uncharacterized protein n=1 Tax=Daphnia pulex TaxID=6669 RepID=E9G840_DAPPU|nr:hypothetical protein DAPPUDRAFT_238587 [Daphnia pulex]|eukprot:EFX84348.1 hypothetical protein DAPPUDRAFT_238587 [Daphnia pulex]
MTINGPAEHFLWCVCAGKNDETGKMSDMWCAEAHNNKAHQDEIIKQQQQNPKINESLLGCGRKKEEEEDPRAVQQPYMMNTKEDGRCHSTRATLSLLCAPNRSAVKYDGISHVDKIDTSNFRVGIYERHQTADQLVSEFSSQRKRPKATSQSNKRKSATYLYAIVNGEDIWARI